MPGFEIEHIKIPIDQWYALGGHANSNLYRTIDKRGRTTHYMRRAYVYDPMNTMAESKIVFAGFTAIDVYFQQQELRGNNESHQSTPSSLEYVQGQHQDQG